MHTKASARDSEISGPLDTCTCTRAHNPPASQSQNGDEVTVRDRADLTPLISIRENGKKQLCGVQIRKFASKEICVRFMIELAKDYVAGAISHESLLDERNDRMAKLEPGQLATCARDATSRRDDDEVPAETGDKESRMGEVPAQTGDEVVVAKRPSATMTLQPKPSMKRPASTTLATNARKATKAEEPLFDMGLGTEELKDDHDEAEEMWA